MTPNRSVRELVGSRRTVLVAFILLWALVVQYYLFFLMFPDGGLSPVRTVSNALLEGVMTPLEYVERQFHPVLEYDRFPGYVAVPRLVTYFYLLAVVVASVYESVTGRIGALAPS